MIEITLIFNTTTINQSVSIGDTVYYSNPTTLGGFDINTTTIELGKDNKFNLSTLLGYYGLAEVRIDSTVKAELFATAAEIFESSK